MISWISKTFSSVKITPENNAISIDNQQIKLLNPYQKREHRTGHPTNYPSLKDSYVSTDINIVSNAYNTRGTKEFSKEWQKDPMTKIVPHNGKVVIHIHIVSNCY